MFQSSNCFHLVHRACAEAAVLEAYKANKPINCPECNQVISQEEMNEIAKEQDMNKV